VRNDSLNVLEGSSALFWPRRVNPIKLAALRTSWMVIGAKTADA
jgi:hypothetical protein